MWGGFALMVPLIGCAAAQPGSQPTFRVCVTLDSGFDMLVDPSMPIADVSRESQLYGFNVDARLHILPTVLHSKNSSYELRVLSGLTASSWLRQGGMSAMWGGRPTSTRGTATAAVELFATLTLAARSRS